MDANLAGARPTALKTLKESVQRLFGTGVFRTKEGAIGAEVFRDNQLELHQYLCLRLGDSDAAARALGALRDAVGRGTAHSLAHAPSKRAALYFEAHNWVEYERLLATHSQPVPLRSPPAERPPEWNRAVDELRRGLNERESELLELSQVRGLERTEIAYVLCLPVHQIDHEVAAALGYARLIFEPYMESKHRHAEWMELALRDAFAVDFVVEPPADCDERRAPLPVGTLVGGRYEVQAQVGGGEFAFVYRARDVRVPGHTVALKVLHRASVSDTERERAVKELSVIASAFHPSLVQFKDHGWLDDRLWFVMPFYSGHMLLDRLDQGALPLGTALAYFEQLARALSALHAAGIRHQDIKPENICLTELRGGSEEDPEVLPVLLDLGVASPYEELALAGTPMYFAPEVAARVALSEPRPIDERADVFALALSLLHAIEPFDVASLDGVELEDFLATRARCAPDGPDDPKHESLRPFFGRWLAADPERRPSSAEFAAELRDLRLRFRGESARGRTREGSWIVLLAGLMLVSAGVSTHLSRPDPTPDRSAAPSSPSASVEPGLAYRLAQEEQRARELEHRLEEVAATRSLVAQTPDR